MIYLRFTRMQVDHTAFIKEGIIILIYVDNILIFSMTKQLMKDTKK